MVGENCRGTDGARGSAEGVAANVYGSGPLAIASTAVLIAFCW
jgi:hypothetical protein